MDICGDHIFPAGSHPWLAAERYPEFPISGIKDHKPLVAAENGYRIIESFYGVGQNLVERVVNGICP